MAAATYIPTTLKKSQVINAGPQVKFDTDTIVCLIVKAGSGIPNTQSNGIQFISDVTATNPELSYVGYSRQTLAGVTVAYDASPSDKVDFSFSNIVWAQNANDDGTGRYIVFADTTIGANDAAHPVIAISDPNQYLNVQNGSLTLQSPTGGLIQWQ
jgi:hypothetical protein